MRHQLRLRLQIGHLSGPSAASPSRIADQDLLDLRSSLNADDIFAYLLDCFIEFALAPAGDKNIGTFLDEPLPWRGLFRCFHRCPACTTTTDSNITAILITKVTIPATIINLLENMPGFRSCLIISI